MAIDLMIFVIKYTILLLIIKFTNYHYNILKNYIMKNKKFNLVSYNYLLKIIKKSKTNYYLR